MTKVYASRGHLGKRKKKYSEFSLVLSSQSYSNQALLT